MVFPFLRRNLKSVKAKQSSSFVMDSFVVDMHAHVLPALDNGPETLNESIELLKEMSEQGVRKVIATPHIMGDYYPNNINEIRQTKNQVVTELAKRCISIELEVAAEYYLDISFLSILEKNQPLLTILGTYLLLETSIVNVPSFLDEAITLIQSRGLVPVLAHPERYNYLQQDFEKVVELHQKGVLFQVNLCSWQSPHAATKILAERLSNEGLVSFMGSNVHNKNEWKKCHESLKSNIYHQSVEMGLLNHQLL